MSGCTGMIWGAVNFMPHECVKLFNLIEEKKYLEAMDLWKLMEPVCLWLGGNRHEVDYLQELKQQQIYQAETWDHPVNLYQM